MHALAVVPKARALDTLLYQVVHLRLSLDSLTKQLVMTPEQQGSLAVPPTGDAAALAVLQARQQLVGRERQPRGPARAHAPAF